MAIEPFSRALPAILGDIRYNDWPGRTAFGKLRASPLLGAVETQEKGW